MNFKNFAQAEHGKDIVLQYVVPVYFELKKNIPNKRDDCVVLLEK